MTHYDDDFIKSIQGFDEILNDDWYERLTKISDDAKLPMELKWFVNELRIAIKALFVVVNSEMHQTNKMKEILSKLPDDEKHQDLKKILEERDNDIEKTLKPISKYTKELEESRTRKPDYIG